jgi:hypothetical protein
VRRVLYDEEVCNGEHDLRRIHQPEPVLLRKVT